MWLDKAVIWRWVVVAIIVFSAMVWGYFIITDNQAKISALPVYGARNIDSTDHIISSFRLKDQDDKIITQDDFKGKIYVSDFFFTNCEGICPLMSNQMERIAEAYKNNPNVLLLSHTVKPDEDSIPALKRYAEEHHADSTKWFFVTGDVNIITELAHKSYLVGNKDSVEGPGFVHTQFFTLIDPQQRIRGFYDGTDSMEVDKLINDIAILVREE